jgi:thioredoxin
MRRLVFSLLSIVFLYISCNSNSKTNQKSEEILSEEVAVVIPEKLDTPEIVGTPVKINSYEFIKYIHDFNTNSTWQYKGSKPCIVDFYADWCRPCKMMDPILEKLAKEYDGEIIIYKINIDNNKDIASAFAINSIPFFLFCPLNGQPQSSMGMMSENDMRTVIENMLNR